MSSCLSLKDYIIIAGIWITNQRHKIHIRFAAHVRRSNLSSELFSYDQAWGPAQEISDLIRPYSQRVEICGSLRRRRQEIKDIDIVCQDTDRFGMITALSQIAQFVHPTPQKILFRYDDVPGEIYCVHSEQEFEVMKLERTGDYAFTQAIARNAIERGYLFRFSVDPGYYKIPMYGLYKLGGRYYDKHEVRHYYANDMRNAVAFKERDILWLLYGKWIEPSERSWAGEDQNSILRE